MVGVKSLKVGFIGAGKRARTAHYPVVSKLENVSIEAIAEMDESRLNEAVEKYSIPRSFLCENETDFQRMLDSVDLDVVYVVMDEEFMTKPALGCLQAGKHVFIEKPAGANLEESCRLLEAAVANDRYCLVGYQRRYAHVTRRAMQAVASRGASTFAMGEFHKPGDFLDDERCQVWRDTAHVIDLVRYMIKSDPAEITAYQDAYPTGQSSFFNALIRFANRSVGFITASRMAGGRKLRAELHGLGVDCYLDPPGLLEIHEAGKKPQVVTGAELAGVSEDDSYAYGGELAMHEHFVDCVRNATVPLTDIRDVIHTSRLVSQIARYP